MKAVILLLFLPLSLFARPGYYEPWGKDADLLKAPVKPVEEEPSSLGVKIAQGVIHFHQNVISPVDGPRSHFRPSSSNYMLGAIKKHGFIKGFLMGCDRLMRENDEAWVYLSIKEDGKPFKYDPP
jgi:hypothetical protein